ncbi:MAG: hypothetical protein MUF54_03450 [Polyangiaceae bacterium]|jgi:hypothetical protein|nr:hypothetical protein [Polyangiaceae bacterium]
MGLFDSIRRPKPHSGQSTRLSSIPPGSPLADWQPARGVVDAYDLADAVGTISLDNGQKLRFGRSACVAFEPVEGIHVVVDSAGTGVRPGLRALRVRAVDVHEVDRLLEARDTSAGVKSTSTLPPQDAWAAARSMGLVTFAFNQHLPDRSRLRDFLTRLQLPGVLDFVPGAILRAGDHSFYLSACNDALPIEDVDTRLVDMDALGSVSFLTLCSGLFAFRSSSRAIVHDGTGRTIDAWTEWGLREACLTAAILAAHATYVVVHPCGHVAFAPAGWLQTLGDLSRSDCRPFGAFTDIGYTSGGESLLTKGMAVWALPDVRTLAQGAEHDDEAYEHARNATLVACATMVHSASVLGHGTVLHVPPKPHIGALPLDFDPLREVPGGVRWHVRASSVDELELARL